MQNGWRGVRDIFVTRLRKQPQYGAAIIFFLFLALTGVGLREMVQGYAIANQERVALEVHAGVQLLNQAQAVEDKASREHLSKYLTEGRLDLPRLRHNLTAMTTDVEDAKSEGNPDRMSTRVRNVEQQFNALNTEIDARRKYIGQLEEKKTSYAQKVAELHSAIGGANSLIAEYVSAGYFPAHFILAQAEVARAQAQYDRAVAVKGLIIENGLPDYVVVHDVATAALPILETATKLARQPAEQVAANAAKLQTLFGEVSEVSSRAARARESAKKLSNYSKYALGPGQLEGADGDVRQANASLSLAQSQNGMRQQRFREAAVTLASVERLLNNANTTYDRAIDTWRDVQNALNNMDPTRDRAKSAISQAEEQIADYSENSQTEAENLVSRARSRISNGNSDRDDDPIAALSAFEDALRIAKQAYDEVDTEDHTVSVPTSTDSDDDDDSGGGYTGSGGGWSDAGSGSSSGHSGGIDSGPSGGIDTSPSGGIDGDY